MRWESYADIGDQRRPARCPFLEHVEHLAAVRHSEVRRLPDAVDERGQRAVRDPLERGLPRVPDADLEGRNPQAVAPLLGDVGDEALLDHRVDQVVGRRPRQVQGARQPVERHRVRLGGQEAQHHQRPGGGGDLAHVPKPSPAGSTCVDDAVGESGADRCSWPARGRVPHASTTPHRGHAWRWSSCCPCWWPPTQAAPMPSKRKWLNDTVKALYGSRTYVGNRVADTGGKLALNLDIDNTSLQTYYDRGKAIPATLRLVRYAKSKGVYILFNTGRHVSSARQVDRASSGARASRSTACALAQRGSRCRTSKQRCRRFYVNNGLHDHRQRRQPEHGLHRRQLRARLPAAQLRQPAGLSAGRAARRLSTGGTSGSSRPRCPDR